MDKRLQKFYADLKKGATELSPKLPQGMRDLLTPMLGDLEVCLQKMSDGDGDGKGAIDPDAVVAPTIGNEAIKGVLTLVDRMHGEISGLQAQLASLDTKITESINTKLAAGELFDKVKVEELKTSAVESAVNAERQLAATLSTRRAELVKLSLPTPLDEEVIKGTDEAFGNAVKGAQARLAKLTEKQITLSSTRLSTMVWCAQDKFDDQVALVEEAAAGKSGRGKPEPMAGGASAPASTVGLFV